jgi:hypothetical protein
MGEDGVIKRSGAPVLIYLYRFLSFNARVFLITNNG